MVDEPKKSTDETAIVKPEDSTEEAEAIDMLEGLPTQEKKLVSREMIRMMGVMKQENPIVKKITPEHIDKFLDGSKLELQESYKERHERKIFQFLIFTVSIVVLGTPKEWNVSRRNFTPTSFFSFLWAAAALW